MNSTIIINYSFILLSILALVSACATSPVTHSESPSLPAGEQNETTLSLAQHRMYEAAKAFDQTVVEGTLAGALAGAAIAILISGDPVDIIEGAAVGSTIGAIAATYVTNKQKEYASSEDALVSMVADVQQQNLYLFNLIQSMREVVTENKRKIDAINKEYEQKQITQADLFRKFERLQADTNKMTEMAKKATLRLNFLKEARKTYERNNPRISTTSLDKEIDTFQEHFNVMDLIVKQLSDSKLG